MEAIMETIRFEHVSFRYEEGKEIFQNLNLTLPKTGFITFLGKSGSGKTTFLSLINGKLKPNEGEIKGIEDEMGNVFQSPLLLDYLDVIQNVSLPLLLEGLPIQEAEEKAIEALKKVHLQDKENQNVLTLSGGEKTRAAIARALVKNTSTLILDEPTGQLDEKNSTDIYGLLKSLSKDHLVLLVTHDEKNACTFSDHVYRLEDGKFIIEKEINNNTTEQSENDEPENPSPSPIQWKEAFALSETYLTRHRIRVMLSSFFIAFALTILSLGINLKNNMSQGMKELFSLYYNREVATLSLKESIAEAGKMTLAKYQTPDEMTLHRFGIRTYYPSFEYFLPTYNEVNLNRKTFDIRFEPVIHEKKDRLSLGKGLEDKKSVVVNSLFLKDFGLTESEAIGRSILFSHSTLVYSKTFKATDLVRFDYGFRISGISKEKGTFNEPVIYYSYKSEQELLKDQNLKNISRHFQTPTSIMDLLENPDYQDEDFTSRKILFEEDDIKKKKEELETRHKGKFRIESKPLAIEENITGILASLVRIGEVFLFLSLICATMLEFISVYSLYDENIRLFALVRTFSHNKSNLLRLALMTGFCFFLITVLLLLMMNLILGEAIRRLLLYYTLPFLLRPLDLPAFLTVIFIALIISFPSAILPLYRIKDRHIKKELEGED